jgi:hypothetical protein
MREEYKGTSSHREEVSLSSLQVSRLLLFSPRTFTFFGFHKPVLNQHAFFFGNDPPTPASKQVLILFSSSHSQVWQLLSLESLSHTHHRQRLNLQSLQTSTQPLETRKGISSPQLPKWANTGLPSEILAARSRTQQSLSGQSTMRMELVLAPMYITCIREMEVLVPAGQYAANGSPSPRCKLPAHYLLE